MRTCKLVCKPLFIPLKREYFEAFEQGTKREELRKYGARWNEDVCWVGRGVVLSLGYGIRNRLRGVIVGFRSAYPYMLEEQQRRSFSACYGPNQWRVAVISIKVIQKEITEIAPYPQSCQPVCRPVPSSISASP